MARLKLERRRKKNDLGKRCTYKTAIKLWHLYIRARKLGMTRKLSARYAIYSVEGDMWHSRSINRMPDKAIMDSRTKWTTNNRIVATPKRLLSLINSAKHTDYKLADLDHVDVHIGYCLDYFESKDGFVAKNVPIAQRNYLRVTGILAPVYEILHRWEWIDVNKWAHITKGRDLFIKGFGTFDIDKAIENIYAVRETWEPNKEKYARGLYCLQPNKIRERGYNVPGHEWLFGIIDPVYMRYTYADPKIAAVLAMYIRKWWHAIKDPKFEQHRWDLYHMDMEEEWLDIPPARLVAQWQVQRQAREEEEKRVLNMKAIERDLYNRKHHYAKWLKKRALAECPTTWEWAAQIFPTRALKTARLCAIVNLGTLEAVGDSLNNCADCYGQICACADGIMVVYERQNGEGVYKPYALCRYNPDGTIGEARIACNKACPPTIKKLFAQYGKAYDRDKYNYLPARIEELKQTYPPITEEQEERTLVPKDSCLHGPVNARYSVV